eukprot:362836-Chlamydomonas_euryale.AAC.11
MLLGQQAGATQGAPGCGGSNQGSQARPGVARKPGCARTGQKTKCAQQNESGMLQQTWRQTCTLLHTCARAFCIH